MDNFSYFFSPRQDSDIGTGLKLKRVDPPLPQTSATRDVCKQHELKSTNLSTLSPTFESHLTPPNLFITTRLAIASYS